MLAGPERRPRALFDGVDHGGGVESPGVLTGSHELFRDWGDAVVRREPHHVFVAADEDVQPIEQRANRPIEVREHVLHLLAARPEGMTDQIGTRKTDAEDVDAAVFPELQRLDERRGEPAEIRVGVRAGLPLRAKLEVRFAAAALEHVWERRCPSRRRRLGQAVVWALIFRVGQQTRPGFAVVGVDRVGFDERFDRRDRPIR